MSVPNECDIVEKERRHLQAHYFNPVQLPADTISSAYAAANGQNGFNSSNVPRYGTVIPNRVFVGGIDFKTKEEDLQKFFCAFGVVRDTKIIRDRAEVSKGYGFVTFESPEEADKVREQQESLYLNGKKLNIGPAVRKQQLCFPKDMHVHGPPGSWVVHPAGYASYTNQNGITYFSPASPLIASQVQPQGAMMTYNSGVAAYQPVAAAPYTTGYSFAGCGNQPYNTVHMPWNHSTVGGSCGQLVAPTGNHSGLEQVNILPVAANQPATGYLVPRTSMPTQTVRAAEAQPVQQDKIAYMPSVEPVRMLIPSSATSNYVAPMPPQSVLHSPTAVYAQAASVKCGHQQTLFGVHEINPAMLGQYGLITIPEGNDNHSSMVVSESEILTPPMTPDKTQ